MTKQPRGIIVVDVQHAGVPDSKDFRGAKVDIDKDGIVELWENEAELTPLYAAALTRECAVLGHKAVVEAYGFYDDRHKRVAELAALFPDKQFVYFAAHINAGGGKSASFFYDGRSVGGKRLAEVTAEQFKTGFPELSGSNIFASYEKPQPGGGPGENEWRGDTSKHWTWGAWNTIKGIYTAPDNVCGICVEPFFLDNEKHAPLATHEGLERIGKALARAADGFIREKTVSKDPLVS